MLISAVRLGKPNVSFHFPSLHFIKIHVFKSATPYMKKDIQEQYMFLNNCPLDALISLGINKVI